MSSLRRHAQSGAAYGLACRLHDVEDVLAYVQSVVARRAATFDQGDREELMAYLLVEAVHMSGIRYGAYPYGPAPKGIYDPRWSTMSFSTWLGWQLPRRVIDWTRKAKGDSRNKTQVRLVSYDDVNATLGRDDRDREDGSIAPATHTIREDRNRTKLHTDPSIVVDQAFIAIELLRNDDTKGQGWAA